MTSISELRRRVAQIERDLGDAWTGANNPLETAWYRIALGIPGDADIEVMLDDSPRSFVDSAHFVVDRDGGTRADQLEKIPAMRLLADVLEAKDQTDQLTALRALRRLATDGYYQTPDGLRPATARDRGLARVYLRVVLGRLADQAKPAPSKSRWPTSPPATESPP